MSQLEYFRGMEVPKLSKEEIARLKKEDKQLQFTINEFFFKKAVEKYLDDRLEAMYLTWSIEDLFPKTSKRLIKKLVSKVQHDRAGLNGKRERYVNELWTEFVAEGRISPN